MITKVKEFLESYWPEYIPILISVISYFIIIHFYPEIHVSEQVVKDVSGLIAQILGGLLGLFLASYTVLYGINFKEIFQKVASDDLKKEVKSEMLDIFKVFYETILFSAIYLLIALVVFSLACISIENTNLFVSTEKNNWNLFIVLMIVGFLVSSILSLIMSVKVLIDLRDL